MSNFDRSVIVEFQNRETGEEFTIQDLKITFQVEKQVSTEPNVANIDIYNLGDDLQARINFKQSLLALEFGNAVTLKAGYKGQEKTIFTGVTVAAITRKEGPLFITSINLRNIFYELMAKPVTRSVGKGEEKAQVVLNVLRDIGATVESSSIQVIRDLMQAATFKFAQTLFGTANQIINQINDGLVDRINVYFDDIGVNFNPLGVALDIPAIEYTTQTGIIGTPQPNETGVDFKVELDPNMRLNAPVTLDSRTIRAINPGGRYVIRKVIHVGSNRADGPFDTNVEAIYEVLRQKAVA